MKWQRQGLIKAIKGVPRACKLSSCTWPRTGAPVKLPADTKVVFVPSEKVHGVHQLSSPAGDEERQIRAGLQAVPEDDPPGESQAGDPGQQLPSSQVHRALASPLSCRL